MAENTNNVQVTLPPSNKIENEGRTSQGRASASEWNTLVSAVAQLRDALVSLKDYIDEKTQESITTDTTLSSTSNNAIANKVVTTNINFIKSKLSDFLDTFQSKEIEILDGDEETKASISANNISATLSATDNLNIKAVDGTINVQSTNTHIYGESESHLVSDDGTSAIIAGDSGVFADASDNKVHIVGDDTEFTYRTIGYDGEQQEVTVNLKSLLLGGQLITYDQYRAIQKKEMITYFVAKDEDALRRNKCWRIYLRAQLIGEFNTEGNLTLPVFPMRFPFRLA